jgi:hypothetical protein
MPQMARSGTDVFQHLACAQQSPKKGRAAEPAPAIYRRQRSHSSRHDLAHRNPEPGGDRVVAPVAAGHYA